MSRARFLKKYEFFRKYNIFGNVFRGFLIFPGHTIIENTEKKGSIKQMFFMRKKSRMIPGLLIGMAVGAAGTAIGMTVTNGKTRRQMEKMFCQAKRALSRSLSGLM